MNSFICSTKKPFTFIGRINEDVNTYTTIQSRGNIFLTVPMVCLQQKSTQQSDGGMTDVYINGGTYLKSFYTVITMPSATSIKLMQSRHPRLHHSISWNNTVPCIISDKYKQVTL